jgi:transposase-like protein
VPFRKLGDENALSPAQTYARVIAELKQLPKNEWLTKTLCDISRFSRILIIDGKYIKVAGFTIRLPFLYAIDYLTHDIPYGDLYPAEDHTSFLDFFTSLQSLGYQPDIVVADDRAGIKQALNRVFPYTRLQLCQNHFLENIRQRLNVRSKKRYVNFFNDLKWKVFLKATDKYSIEEGWREVWKQYAKNSAVIQDILKDIDRRKTELFNYLKIPNSPNNTNLIELYNSHLNGRLKTIKGFQNTDSASRWLNAYLIRRRTKPLTDCEGKFKHLNKHSSLEFTIKKQAQWPDILTNLGIKRIKFFQKSD